MLFPWPKEKIEPLQPPDTIVSEACNSPRIFMLSRAHIPPVCLNGRNLAVRTSAACQSSFIRRSLSGFYNTHARETVAVRAV
jgi:hypothetical protein